MVSVPSQRYGFILKFRPRQELGGLKVRRRWDKKKNTVAWLRYKAMKTRWRKFCRQLTRLKKEKKKVFREMRDFQFMGWMESVVRVSSLWSQAEKETQRRWEVDEIAGTTLKSSRSTQGGCSQQGRPPEPQGRPPEPQGRPPARGKGVIFCSVVALPADAA